MANSYFQFKEFTIQQDRCAMKVTTDACLFGAWVAQQLRKEAGYVYLLDIGAGTGVLSMMIGQKNQLVMEAIEVDPDARQQCKENFETCPWGLDLMVQEGDARYFQFSHLFDVIVSNPPFYENELSSPDKRRSLALHSDKLSLEELLNTILKNLEDDGIFFLLLPFKRNNEIKGMLTGRSVAVHHLCFVRPTPIQDFTRVMMACKRKKEDDPVMTLIDEMSIKDANDEYTPEFISLLKDYYLNL